MGESGRGQWVGQWVDLIGCCLIMIDCTRVRMLEILWAEWASVGSVGVVSGCGSWIGLWFCFDWLSVCGIC